MSYFTFEQALYSNSELCGATEEHWSERDDFVDKFKDLPDIGDELIDYPNDGDGQYIDPYYYKKSKRSKEASPEELKNHTLDLFASRRLPPEKVTPVKEIKECKTIAKPVDKYPGKFGKRPGEVEQEKKAKLEKDFLDLLKPTDDFGKTNKRKRSVIETVFDTYSDSEDSEVKAKKAKTGKPWTERELDLLLGLYRRTGNFPHLILVVYKFLSKNTFSKRNESETLAKLRELCGYKIYT